MDYQDTVKYMKFSLKIWIVSLLLLLPNFVNSQSLREFFSNRTELNRDDFPDSTDVTDELSFNEMICRDKELFPKKFILKNTKRLSNANIAWIVFKRLAT